MSPHTTPRRTAATTAVALLLLVAAAGAAGWYAARGSAGYGGDGGELAATLSVASALGDAGAGYAEADAPRTFRFPADHGPHPDFRTEWWYLTGNLARAGTGSGEPPRRFGYQLTVFRTAVAPHDTSGRTSDWATRQVYMAHLAVTDVAGGGFHAFQRYARGAAGLAGARGEPFRVWVEDWQVAGPKAVDGGATTSPPRTFPLHLTAAEDGVALDLHLAAGGPPVLQGDGGLSRKGRGPDAGASYYYSLPRLPTRGTLHLGDETFAVEGASWLDREWSSAVLGAGEEGWDWFAVQLDDGRDLVFFRIRGGDGPEDRLGYAALLSPAGAAADLAAADAEPRQAEVLDVTGSSLRAVGHWRSRASGVRYPSGWRLLVPAAGLHLGFTPLLDDQELDLDFRYWEGAIHVEGTADGEPVRGRGYAELTGYGDVGGLR